MRAFLYTRVSVIPQALEAPGAELHVLNGVANVSMAQVRLDQSEIRPALCQVVAARMPEGMRMDIQRRKSRSLRHSVNHQAGRARCHWSATLRDENKVASFRTFAQEAPQCSNFQPTQTMVTRNAPLGAPDVENPLLKVELAPAGLQTLLYAQSVREQNQDEGRIPVAVAVFACGFDEFFHLILKQVFPASRTATRPRLCHCSPYGNWHHIAHTRNPQYSHRVAPRHCSQKAHKENS